MMKTRLKEKTLSFLPNGKILQYAKMYGKRRADQKPYMELGV
jgi:hypothetical protein